MLAPESDRREENRRHERRDRSHNRPVRWCCNAAATSSAKGCTRSTTCPSNGRRSSVDVLARNRRLPNPVPEKVILTLAERCEPPTLTESHGLAMEG